MTLSWWGRKMLNLGGRGAVECQARPRIMGRVDTGKQRAPLVIVDVDGVIADLSAWAPILVDPAIPPRQRWRSFFGHVEEAVRIETGAALVDELADLGYRIAYSTTRPAWLTFRTRSWITGNGLPDGYVYTRGKSDSRPADEVKREHCALAEVWTKQPIAAFVDDEPGAVAALRAAGLPAYLPDDVVGRAAATIGIPRHTAGLEEDQNRGTAMSSASACLTRP
jgi:hypothetical protein